MKNQIYLKNVQQEDWWKQDKEWQLQMIIKKIKIWWIIYYSLVLVF